MFTKLMQWLNFEIRTVDSVLSDFKKTIARLEQVALEHANKARDHAEEIAKHTEEQIKSNTEASRASAVVMKLKDLVG